MRLPASTLLKVDVGQEEKAVHRPRPLLHQTQDSIEGADTAGVGRPAAPGGRVERSPTPQP